MILREMKADILRYFDSDSPKGLILAGIVGCGKTTLVQSCLETLKNRNVIYAFSGDDTVFRNQIAKNSKYLYEFIRGQTQEQVLVFIDEVQKCEEIFDALKYIFDKGKTSFIVSGSNPSFLQSVARKRLQRRADFKILFPFSLPEILLEPEVQKTYHKLFIRLLGGEFPTQLPHLELTPLQRKNIHRYLLRGGLPLSFLSSDDESALVEVQKVFDRGFEPIRAEMHSLSDTIAVELAKIHAREFTYANLINKTRIRHRQIINQGIDALIDNGYLGVVTPFLFDEEKKTYLKKYFYVDPGLVTYLTGFREIEKDLGCRVEGLVYSRLLYRLQFEITKNKGLYFFKNYTLKSDGSLRFSKGEVDAIYHAGKLIIPIEIKSTDQWTSVNTEALEKFVRDKKTSFGLVFYAGPPMKMKNTVFWPYWLI